MDMKTSKLILAGALAALLSCAGCAYRADLAQGNFVEQSQVDKLRAASLTVPQTIEVLYDLDQQDGEKLPIDALSIEECADILEQEYLN